MVGMNKMVKVIPMVVHKLITSFTKVYCRSNKLENIQQNNLENCPGHML